jgi:hypothetical protein
MGSHEGRSALSEASAEEGIASMYRTHRFVTLILLMVCVGAGSDGAWAQQIPEKNPTELPPTPSVPARPSQLPQPTGEESRAARGVVPAPRYEPESTAARSLGRPLAELPPREVLPIRQEWLGRPPTEGNRPAYAMCIAQCDGNAATCNVPGPRGSDSSIGAWTDSDSPDRMGQLRCRALSTSCRSQCAAAFPVPPAGAKP